MTKSKSIPFAQYIDKLANEPAIKQHMDQLKKMKQETPAVFNRKHSKELMDLCMEINGREGIIAWCTDYIQNNPGMSNDALDTVWARRKNETYKVANLYAKYDQLVAELDLAVHNEQAKSL